MRARSFNPNTLLAIKNKPQVIRKGNVKFQKLNLKSMPTALVFGVIAAIASAVGVFTFTNATTTIATANTTTVVCSHSCICTHVTWTLV